MASFNQNMRQTKGPKVGTPPMTPQGLAALTGAIGGPAFSPPPPVGLNTLAPAPQAPNPINPMQRIYNKPQVSDVMAMLANSGADAATMQAILAATTAPYEQQQALMQQKKADLANAATQVAATLPEGQAASVLATQFPQFQGKPVMDATLTGAFGQTSDPSGLGLLNPAYASAGATQFDTTEKQALATGVLDKVATQPGTPTDYASLTAFRDAARQTAMAAGYDQTATQAAVNFAESYWALKAHAPESVAHTYGDPGAITPGSSSLASQTPRRL